MSRIVDVVDVAYHAWLQVKLPRRTASTTTSLNNRQQRRFYGFGGFHSSEALPGALPTRQFAPQKPPYGLYPELLSGTTFTAPRAKNRYNWMYRLRPSAMLESSRGSFEPAKSVSSHRWTVSPATNPCPPIQFRFPPVEVLTHSTSSFHFY